MWLHYYTLLAFPYLTFVQGVKIGGGEGGGGGAGGGAGDGGAGGSHPSDGPPISQGVELTGAFSDALQTSSFIIEVILAVFLLFQVTRGLSRLLCSPAPTADAKETTQDTLTPPPPSIDDKPGAIFNILIALSSSALLAYWILSLIAQGVYEITYQAEFVPIESSPSLFTLTPDVPRAFLACKQWTYRFADTCISAAILFLLLQRANGYRDLIGRSWLLPKVVLDGGILLSALITQVIGAALDDSWDNFDSGFIPEVFPMWSTYRNTTFAYAIFELLLAFDMLFTSVWLWNSLVRIGVLDSPTRTISKFIAPLFLIAAFMNLAVVIVAFSLSQDADIDWETLALCHAIIYGFGTLLVVLMSLGIGKPAKKAGENITPGKP